MESEPASHMILCRGNLAAELTCPLFQADDVETALAWARVSALAMWRYMSAMPALPTYTLSFLMPSERGTPSSMTCMRHQLDS